MAQNKSDLFESAHIELSNVAKALSHPARLEILKVLAQKNACICGEIVEVLPLSQSTVSQHLKALKAAGLITGEVEGVRSCYCIDWEKLGVAWKQLQEFGVALNNWRNGGSC